MNELIIILDAAVNTMKMNMPVLLLGLGILWGINILNWLIGSRLNVLGIIPRHPFGLIGIVFSPFLHGNFQHLFYNSIPLLVLSIMVLLYGLDVYIKATVTIILAGGFLVWLFGRKAIHIGASGLIMGYLGFLIASAYHQGTFMAIIVGFVTIYYFAALLLSVLPGEEKTSWEGHLFGLLAGFLASYLFSGAY